MKMRPYSAGGVKHSFWFMEFKKIVALRNEGLDWDNIKLINEEQNIFGASTPERARQIFQTVSARVKCLDDSFYQVFINCDLASQKLFALLAAMVYDSLFGEFVYDVVREKMIIGSCELADSDIRIFFKNKQLQDDKVAAWTDATLKRLGASYKSLLFEANVTDKTNGTRHIFKPLPDPQMERWMQDHGYDYQLKALTGVR